MKIDNNEFNFKKFAFWLLCVCLLALCGFFWSRLQTLENNQSDMWREIHSLTSDLREIKSDLRWIKEELKEIKSLVKGRRVNE